MKCKYNFFTGKGKEPVGSALFHLNPGAAPLQPVRDDPQRQPDPGQPQQGQVPGSDHGGEGLHPGDRPGRLPQEADQHLPADQVRQGRLEPSGTQVTNAR